jgi:hypothetical protein
MKVQEYLREDGSSPYQEWFDTLDIYAATKVSTAIALRAREQGTGNREQ